MWNYQFLNKRVCFKMIFVIDDDEIMIDCIKNAINDDVRTFLNAIDAMSCISDGVMPDLMFLDIMLDGPDGFTFLNELSSYPDTAKIPVVVVSSLDFNDRDLSNYGVVGYLNKETMTPGDIKGYVSKYRKK